MRRLLLASAILGLGCSRAETPSPDSALAVESSDPAFTRTMAPGEAPASSDGHKATDAPQPVGTVHEVRMIGDAGGYRYDPAALTINEGDAVRFVVGDGGPHNAAFDGAGLSSETQTRLDRNLSERMGPLATALLTEPGETVTVSFTGIPSATYSYHCSSHAALGMRGSITVQ